MKTHPMKTHPWKVLVMSSFESKQARYRKYSISKDTENFFDKGKKSKSIIEE